VQLIFDGLLVSIVTGNLGHTLATYDVMEKAMFGFDGICGSYGLMYVLSNTTAVPRLVLSRIGASLLYGFVLRTLATPTFVEASCDSSGILCGPKYGKSYLRRKWRWKDASSRGYRQAMGFGTKPSRSGAYSLPVVWIAALVALIASKISTIPKLPTGLCGLVPGNAYT
jgi:hypothetical protein